MRERRTWHGQTLTTEVAGSRAPPVLGYFDFRLHISGPIQNV
jgi:hypothetical protein